MFAVSYDHDPCLSSYMRRWEVDWPDPLPVFPFVGMIVKATSHRYGTPWAVIKRVDRGRMVVLLGPPEDWRSHKEEYILMHGD